MSRKKTTEQFIKEAKEKHGDKYDYSLVEYKNNKEKVRIICPIHGIFEQSPVNHVKRNGCPECGIKKRAKSKKFTTEQFIEKSKKIHDDKYDYSLVEYKGIYEKVKIICPTHGVFEQRATNHLLGYGCSKCVNRHPGNIKKIEEKINNKDLDFSQSFYLNNKTPIKVICKKCGTEFHPRPDNLIHFKTGCPICNTSSGTSKPETEIFEYIKKLNEKAIRNTKKIIPPYEIDIFIPEKNIGIEFNGLYWHSERIINKSNRNGKNYHLDKLKLAQEKNIRLIQIFEDEFTHKKEIVINRLKHMLGFYERSIGGRKTIVKEVSSGEKNIFLNTYHIQGTDNSSIKIGAYYKDELISVMTFGKKRIALGNKSDGYELLRFATKFGIKGQGIASRLFSYFIKNYSPKSIVTYSDKRWNTGNLYKQLGFEYSHSSNPNYWYIEKDRRLHRFGFRKSVLNERLDFFDSNLTEYENMLRNGYDRIWDCGNDVWIYNE